LRNYRLSFDFFVDWAAVGTFNETVVSPVFQTIEEGADRMRPISAVAVAAQLPTLEELYDAHAQFVYRSLISLGVPASNAEDAMQEVFLVVHAKLPEFQGTYFKAWLFRLALSVARNARRSARRADHVAAPIDPDSLEDSRGGSPFDKAAHAERIKLLHDLLDQLDDEKRQVFVLAELEQMPQVEIADALDIHVNTVAYRLNAAKERLQQLLQRFYARSHERNP
jgi:RNA polymerase sigma-70 factor (ECF subfamily)